MSFLSHRTKLVVAFAMIYGVWGTTFLANQVSLKSYPPFLLSGLRLTLAGAALSLLCLARKETWPTPVEVARHAACGLVIFIGGIVAVVWAQQFLSSSLASTIITTPFWFVALDRRQWKFYFSNAWIPLGLLIGLGGVILLMIFKQGRTGSESEWMQLVAIMIIVVGSFMWASISLFLRYHPSKTSVYVNTAIQLLSAGLGTLLLSSVTGELPTFSISTVRLDSTVALLYLSIISSLLGFLAYIWLVKVQPPAIVSTYAYVNPLVATLLGWSIAGEQISTIQLLALGLILAGVLLVNIPNYLGKPDKRS